MHGDVTKLAAAVAGSLVLSMLGQGIAARCAAAQENNTRIPAICAYRETAVITLIDDHGMVEDLRPENLTAAFSAMLDARALCYAGRTGDAVAAYDAILHRLGPLHMGRKD